MPEIEFFGLSFCKILEFLENFIEFLGNSSKFMTTFAKFWTLQAYMCKFLVKLCRIFFCWAWVWVFSLSFWILEFFRLEFFLAGGQKKAALINNRLVRERLKWGASEGGSSEWGQLGRGPAILLAMSTRSADAREVRFLVEYWLFFLRIWWGRWSY